MALTVGRALLVVATAFSALLVSACDGQEAPAPPGGNMMGSADAGLADTMGAGGSGGAPGASQVVPSEAAALRAFLEAGSYKGFKAEAAIHASSGPHGRVRTFVNDVLAASLTTGATVHPAGAAAIKELHSGADLRGWAVLVKTQTDTAAGEGYYWYEVTGGRILADGNNAFLCAGCHKDATDYVFTAAF